MGDDGVWEEYEGVVVGFSGYVELGDDGQGLVKGSAVKEEVRDGRGGERRESDLVHSGH